MDTLGSSGWGKVFIKIFCNLGEKSKYGVAVRNLGVSSHPGFSQIGAVKNMPRSSLVATDVVLCTDDIESIFIVNKPTADTRTAK